MNEKLSGEFIAGFVEGEGCFSLNYDTAGSYGNRTKYLRPMFSLGNSSKDKLLLEKIQEIIGCGRIYYEKNRDFYSYRIYRKTDLQNILIPFFEKYQFHGSKKIAFENFKEIMRIISKRKRCPVKNEEERLLKLKRKLIKEERFKVLLYIINKLHKKMTSSHPIEIGGILNV